jgi:hypothetical protein
VALSRPGGRSLPSILPVVCGALGWNIHIVFLAYTYRWIRPRDDPAMALAARAGRSPVRRQLLGEGTSATGYWIPTDEDVPLRAVLDGS